MGPGSPSLTPVKMLIEAFVQGLTVDDVCSKQAAIG